ncbi:Transposase [compost metagenome]
MGSQPWRTEPRKNYTNDFKLRMVELASHPGASVAQIAREYGINDNIIFKWLRLWQNEGRISRRLPATIAPSSSPVLLPVEVISAPTQSDDKSAATCQHSSLNATSCHVEFNHGKMTLDNPSPELLAVLIRELTGRTMK